MYIYSTAVEYFVLSAKTIISLIDCHKCCLYLTFNINQYLSKPKPLLLSSLQTLP